MCRLGLPKYATHNIQRFVFLKLKKVYNYLSNYNQHFLAINCQLLQIKII